MVIKTFYTKNGKEYTKNETVYTVYDYPYNVISWNYTTVRKKGKRAIAYIDSPATFDIETTTINSEKPYAFMYHWQFCYKGNVCFGTRWEEFTKFLSKLGEYLELSALKQLVIYVHNLAYEFMFVKDFLYIESLFAREAHKIIKFNACLKSDYLRTVNRLDVSCETFPHFEFRCSYFLSNMSLAKFCENSKFCVHHKLEDRYDYKKIRTPDTPQTETELSYEYNDVKGLEECILSKLDDYNDTLATIPLTSTGYVRREMRKACREDKHYRELFETLMPTPEVYTLLRKAFRGGNTHASRYYADAIIDNVYSMDRVSSYPACICSDLYPMTPFIEYIPKNFTQLLSDCNKKKNAIIMQVTFKSITLHDDVTVPYIDFAHCTSFSKEYINDNGRVLSAEWVTYACTELDFIIICNQYHFEGIEWICGYMAKKDYLPAPIVSTMLDFYDKKHSLRT